MRDKEKTKEQLVAEIAELSQRVAELEALETKRKRTEEALRKSEELFSDTFFMSPIPSTITTVSDGRILQVNEAFARLTGYRQEDIVGASTVELQMWADSDEREKVLNILRKNGKVRNVEIRVCNTSGEIHICLYSGNIIEYDGEPRLFSMAIEISDCKMPGESGFEVYLYCKEKKPELTKRFLFLTGDIADPESLLFFKGHQVPRLSKPFDLKNLIASVNTLLLQQRSLDISDQ